MSAQSRHDSRHSSRARSAILLSFIQSQDDQSHKTTLVATVSFLLQTTTQPILFPTKCESDSNVLSQGIPTFFTPSNDCFRTSPISNFRQRPQNSMSSSYPRLKYSHAEVCSDRRSTRSESKCQYRFKPRRRSLRGSYLRALRQHPKDNIRKAYAKLRNFRDDTHNLPTRACPYCGLLPPQRKTEDQTHFKTSTRQNTRKAQEHSIMCRRDRSAPFSRRTSALAPTACRPGSFFAVFRETDKAGNGRHGERVE